MWSQKIKILVIAKYLYFNCQFVSFWINNWCFIDCCNQTKLFFSSFFSPFKLAWFWTIYVTPPAISTVFPIYRILYSISIGSILNIWKPHFDKTYQNTHTPTPLQSLKHWPFLLRFYVLFANFNATFNAITTILIWNLTHQWHLFNPWFPTDFLFVNSVWFGN